MKKVAALICYALGGLGTATVFLLVVSCQSGGRSASDGLVQSDSGVPDTMLQDVVSTDTMVAEVVVPKNADEYFNDFIYSFTTNRRYQFSRVVFPLPYYRDGSKTFMQRSQWEFSRMHTESPVYTVIFDRESSLSLEKSCSVEKVVIEWFFMLTGRVQDYCFSRREGIWKLREVKEYPLAQHPDSGFVSFYQKFATDTIYQYRHLAEDIIVSMPDPDDGFETLNGSIGPDQWPMFRPELPRDVFTNIQYGQCVDSKNQRVLAIEGSSNEFLMLLFFRHTDRGWQLYKIKG